MSDLTKKVFKVFSEQPLTPEQSNLYIPLDELRGSYNTVRRLAGTIRADQGTTQVLAGHKGGGKSTELMKLQQELEQGHPKYFVVFCSSDEDIDRNDIDFPEILLVIVRKMAEQLNEKAKITLKPGYFKSRLESFKELLGSSIEFDKFDLGISTAKISGKIKNSPATRALLRTAMEPDTDNLLAAANDLIGEATLKLSEQGYDGLVILFDDLDKMIVRPMDDSRHTTDEHLFINRSPQMTGFHCHIVYSMPLTLAYSKHHQTLKNLYGGQLPAVPMIKLKAMPPDGSIHPPGIAAMRKIIAARLNSEQIAFGDVFDSEETCKQLIQLSGGQPSVLMSLVKEAVIADTLPIAAPSLQRIRREGMREFRRQLRLDHWAIVEEFRQNGRHVTEEAEDSVFRDLLESRALLQYVNDEEWYGLNPFVELLEPPAGIKPDASKS